MSITSPISAIRPIALPELTQAGASNTQPGGFKSVLDGLIGGVEQSQNQAQQAVSNFLTGGNEELHSVALATQRASLEFELFMQVRNKVVSAYQEVMRMQL
ncbi:MAG TPA: flagellar hook-basal body complex protein FliE [Bryobacteraceae bacterium]|nr:flagellar hook-basal body complex protein FliE [Bryobacteraceae bacterium]